MLMFRKLFKKKELLEVRETAQELSIETETAPIAESSYLHFENFNFKLAILQILMYDFNVLDSQFDIYEFVDTYNHRPIYLQEEGYDIIPEVYEYFKDIEIEVDYAQYVQEIVMDPMHEIYTHIFPYWDGSDDLFDINEVSFHELSQFKNLKKIDLMGRPNIDSRLTEALAQ